MVPFIYGDLARSNTIHIEPRFGPRAARTSEEWEAGFPVSAVDSPYNKPSSTLYLPSLLSLHFHTIGSGDSDYMAASSTIPLNLQWIFMLDYDIRNSRVARLLVDSHKLVDLYRVRWAAFASSGRSGQWQMSRLTPRAVSHPRSRRARSYDTGMETGSDDRKLRSSKSQELPPKPPDPETPCKVAKILWRRVIGESIVQFLVPGIQGTIATFRQRHIERPNSK